MNELYIAVICICAGVAVAVTAILQRRKLLRISQSIEDTLDRMIAGNFVNSENFYDDTLSAKINTKLKRLYEVLESQRQSSQLQHTQIQQLISDISHQVKTPVANIRMLNDTLASGSLPPDKRTELQVQMDTQISKLDFLMQALVKSSRLETGAIKLSPQPLSVLETLAQAVSGVAIFAEDKQIEITVDCDPHIHSLHDRKWTAEALFNILDNAVKYTLPHGSVEVACAQWELFTKIDIRDTGPGIREDELAQVFQRFYRSPSAMQQEGIGIGLYLAREIIEKQGGYIKLTSLPGEGAVFSVFLPNS